MRHLRLAALREAPYAFASTYAAERDETPDGWQERASTLTWFVARRTGGSGGWPPPRSAPGSAARPVVASGSVGLAAGRVEGSARHVLSMWVDPASRGRGVAGALLGAVRGWAVGADVLRLWVADGNTAAMRAYRRAGFAPSGRRQPLPSDPSVEEELWMLTLDPGS